MKQNYTLIRSRRKTLSLTVKPDCTVEVRAPLTLSTAKIDEFVAANSSWIEKKLKKARELAEQKQSYTTDYSGTVCFFGQRIPIEAACTRTAKLEDSRVLMPYGLDSEQIREQLIKLYKKTAREYISGVLPAFEEQTGLNCSSLTITSAATNWGSCTADRLHFSWHLIMAEKEVIDYVIIHELTHIKHRNHSKEFWDEVSKHCPGYKQLRNRLKFYSEVLIKENW